MKRKPETVKSVDDFIQGAKDNTVVKDTNDGLKSKTSYLRPDQIKAIKKMAFFEELGESEIVRDALDKYIPAKYFKDNM